ncbi:MAG: RluA family pseudouridine synthase [Lachnospiraceae bacterium]|nr:RluA family pseudouridine synthase [Lachnospiraceae bacterium]
MKPETVPVLFEDEDILVVHKRAGLATQSRAPGEPDLIRVLKINGTEGFLSPVNRLDQPVEGVVLLAKSEKAAAALSESLKRGDFKKTYRCLVVPRLLPPPAAGEVLELKDCLVREKGNFVRVAKEGEEGQTAKLTLYFTGEIRLIETPEEITEARCAAVNLITGRHHQIRVQLSHARYPILGDRKYGIVPKGYREGLALAAVELGFPHPRTGEQKVFEITPWFMPGVKI